MNTFWVDEAIAELEEAALYYGGIEEELGRKFSAAAATALADIESDPERPRRFDGKARKVRLKRFPYAIIYWVSHDIIHIIGVMHLHREPGYWHGRLTSP